MLKALDILTERGLILCRRGNNRKPSVFRLTFMDTVQMSLPARPDSVDPVGDHRTESADPVGDHRTESADPVGDHRTESADPVGDHSGPRWGPQNVANTLFPLDHLPIDIDTDPITPYIDRLRTDPEPTPAPNDTDPPNLRAAKIVNQKIQAARPNHYPPHELDIIKTWLTQLLTKNGPLKKQTPPAQDIDAAQLLALATPGELITMFYDLQGHTHHLHFVDSYAYFISYAVQRLHGISPTIYKQAREERKAQLRIAKRPQRAAAAEAAAAAPLDTAALIANLAKKRTF